MAPNLQLLIQAPHLMHFVASMAIDATKCIKCGACINNCKFGAISVK